MAIKDWRETMQDGWTNDKNWDKIRIHYEDGGKYAFYLYDKDWKVKKIKNFPSYNSYQKAVIFTKSYMRSH